MDEQGNDGGYDKMVALIADVEATAPKSDTVFIDSAAAAPSQPQQASQKTYDQLVELIDALERGRAPLKAPEKKAQPSPHLLMSGVTQASYAYGVTPPVPPAPQPQMPKVQKPAVQAVQPAQQAESQKRQKERVTEELGAIVKKISSFKPKLELKKKNINRNDLVLPSLSIADQISEVERIIEGLREHVFDSEHLDIVSQEIFGMNEFVTEEKANMKGKGTQISPLEQSLWDLRDQRLAEATDLLRSSGVS